MPESKQLNILIVDDVDTTNTLLRGLVLNVLGGYPQNYSVNVFQASDARHAIDFLKTKSIHLAFLDIELPDQSGLELLGAITAHFADTKCVMVSGNGTKGNVVNAISKGVLGFIVKPFNKARVKEAIDNYLAHHQKTKKVKVDNTKKKLIDFVRQTHG